MLNTVMPLLLILGLIGILLASAILLGWTVPLTIGLARLRKARPHGRGLVILGSVWAGLALCTVALLVASLVLIQRGDSPYPRSFSDQEETQPPDTFSGPAATVNLGWNGRLLVKLHSEPHGSLRLAATNGTLQVPAGSCEFQVIEALAVTNDRTWKAVCRLWNDNERPFAAGSTTNMPIGPPLTAALKIEWSAISPDISLSPLYVDGAGNAFQVSCDESDAAIPEFQFLDAAGQVVWSNRFEFG